MTISPVAESQNPAPLDLEALKARQHGAWSSGDYAVVGTTLQIVGEELCEALQPGAWSPGDYAGAAAPLLPDGEHFPEPPTFRPDQKPTAAGPANGTAPLAAGRRGCGVVSLDWVRSGAPGRGWLCRCRPR